MKELVDQINAEIAVFTENAAAQVEKGNKAAGARARKAALNLMKLMKDFRKASVEASKYSPHHLNSQSGQLAAFIFLKNIIFFTFSATKATTFASMCQV